MDFDYHIGTEKSINTKETLRKPDKNKKEQKQLRTLAWDPSSHESSAFLPKPRKKQKKTIFRDSWLSPPIHKTSVFFCFLEVWLVFPKTKTSGKLFSLFLLFFFKQSWICVCLGFPKQISTNSLLRSALPGLMLVSYFYQSKYCILCSIRHNSVFLSLYNANMHFCWSFLLALVLVVGLIYCPLLRFGLTVLFA